MTRFVRLLASISCLFLLGGCLPGGDTADPPSMIGTKAVIQAHGNELLLEVKNITGNTVISEITNWAGEFVSKRHYYRGMYPIAGTEGTSQWELDFDVTKIDSLFPLEVGKMTSFGGTMIDITSNRSFPFWSRIKVKAQKPFLLPSGSETVYVLKISTEYDLNGRTKRSYETIYYAPALQLNLKGVMHEEASQRYWRIVSISPPDQAVTRPKRPRSGTVMI